MEIKTKMMKKQFLTLMIMIVSATFVTSCGSDDDDNPIGACGDGIQMVMKQVLTVVVQLVILVLQIRV